MARAHFLPPKFGPILWPLSVIGFQGHQQGIYTFVTKEFGAFSLVLLELRKPMSQLEHVLRRSLCCINAEEPWLAFGHAGIVRE